MIFINQLFFFDFSGPGFTVPIINYVPRIEGGVSYFVNENIALELSCPIQFYTYRQPIGEQGALLSTIGHQFLPVFLFTNIGIQAYL